MPTWSRPGPVAELVGIEGGVVSGVFNLESSGADAPDCIHAMKNISTKSDPAQPATDTPVYLFDHWFDSIEVGLRGRMREFIQL